MKVTIFPHIKATQSPFYRDVTYVLDRIKNGKSRALVDQIRFEVDAERRNALKQGLPSICFSGTFKTRSISGLTKHSGLVCLDFDKYTNEDDLIAARDTVIGDPYVMAVWRSPSYTGFKVLVKVPPEKEKHKSYFDALAEHFSAIPGFDRSGSDVSRVCYESYDPELYYNPDSQIWLEGEEVDLSELGTTTPVLPLESENRIIQNLLKWWERKYGRKKGERNTNAYKLAVALHDFGISQREALHVLKDLEEADFPEKEIVQVVNSAYKNEATFHTRFFEDYSKKRNIEKEILNGKSLKQIEKQFPDIPNIATVAEQVKDNIVVEEFWRYDDNGKFRVVDHKFKRYIQNNFVYKYFPNPDGDPVFVQIQENRVRIITRKHIKDMVLKELEQRPDIGMIPFDEMASNTKYFTDDYLSFLDTINIEIKKDTRWEGYLYYRDRVLRVLPDKVEEIEYIDLDGYVWDNHLIDRSFKKADGSKSVFSRFVWLLAGEDQSRYNSIRSTMGYLLHSFKNRGNNRAIILNDEVISENPNGGSGKGIYAQAISKMKRTSIIDGKTFDPTKSFAYQTANIDTQVLVFDDVKKNFPFESIFSVITEGMTYERKNKDAIKLSIQDSPRVLISTNYTIGGVGGSFDRRKFEVEFSSHFGAHYTPYDEFGHMLFDDWNEEEMNLFDNFMVECLQLYLTHGLIECEQKNLQTRKFIKDTCQEFYEWVEDGNIQHNVRINRSELLTAFITDNKEQERYTNSRKLMKWLDAYALWKGYKHISGKSEGVRWSIIQTTTTPVTTDTTPNTTDKGFTLEPEEDEFTLF